MNGLRASCLRPFGAWQKRDFTMLTESAQGELRLRKRGCPGVRPWTEGGVCE